jgi:phosphoribosylanthranilate isomerase
MTWVKVCGITNLEDALVAAEAGADALGFVFAPASPRRVEPEEAAAIAARLPRGIKTVGVFVDAPAQEVLRVAQLCRLDLVQLHGQEGPEFCTALPVRAIKAFRVRGPETLAALAAYREAAWALLLDGYLPGQAGGTGRGFDHSLALEAKRFFGKIIVAGGLSAESVAQTVQMVRPFGVDASSRLEISPGLKDHQLVRQFISEIRRADAT